MKNKGEKMSLFDAFYEEIIYTNHQQYPCQRFLRWVQVLNREDATC
ncbi:hypothetical protein [Sulfuricurvum sp. IAE1]|nr:hypothetical protein [Sulfuricurvum sp. IAE1]